MCSPAIWHARNELKPVWKATCFKYFCLHQFGILESLMEIIMGSFFGWSDA